MSEASQLIAFALVGFALYRLGLVIERLIRPDVDRSTGFPLGVAAVGLGAGMFFGIYEKLSAWLGFLFVAVMAVSRLTAFVLRKGKD